MLNSRLNVIQCLFDTVQQVICYLTQTDIVRHCPTLSQGSAQVLHDILCWGHLSEHLMKINFLETGNPTFWPGGTFSFVLFCIV